MIRCLKRYIARELYHHALRADLNLPAPPPAKRTAIVVSINCGAGPHGRTRRDA